MNSLKWLTEKWEEKNKRENIYCGISLLIKVHKLFRYCESGHPHSPPGERRWTVQFLRMLHQWFSAALCQEYGIHLLFAISISCEFLCIQVPSEKLTNLSSFQKEQLPLGRCHWIKSHNLGTWEIQSPTILFIIRKKKYVKIFVIIFPSHNQIFTRMGHFIWELMNQDKLFLYRKRIF